MEAACTYISNVILISSVDQLCWEVCVWVRACKSGPLSILHRQGGTRMWRFMFQLCHRWTSLTRTLLTSELSLSLFLSFRQTRTYQYLSALFASDRCFFHRTLPFSEFVKRASEKKQSDFFLCEVRLVYRRQVKYKTVIKGWKTW